ncbi:hypothetical protein [Rhizobium sp. BK491]|uniref:hypothetical protein n=1 Tax=Rhizobium sp. BK491 TaxID=2587009 RepID=UPI001618BC4F|nr:hypothetical protein [Rhizobium sp. BK491]MBB3568723.1 hypothetical protein [Rhizobium sp. BK491]
MSDEYSGLPKVIKVIDDYDLVINRGSDHGIVLGSRFLVFSAGEQLNDPDTGEDLGILEIVRGKARVVHVQAKMSTLSSDEFATAPGTKRVIKRTGAIWAFSNQGSVEEITEGQERQRLALDIESGDYVRPI